MPGGYMNPQYGDMMEGRGGKGGIERGGGSNSGGKPSTEKVGQHHPHIAIHSHSKGHEVHITHHDGQHEHYHHEPGDSEGIAQHIHETIGGDTGQDHGGSSGDEMEDEYGLGGPGV